ncbi:MAG TPA: CheR family methyltransferase, partial [Myxococcaceae bacterium]|nr:CheR family methyltransferase [Myxococcaceae bacterium]
GLKITPDSHYSLKLALSARMPALGISDGLEYVRRLHEMAGEHELRSLLPLVTVGKTDFFRDGRQFGALEKRLIPEMLTQARGRGSPGRIWSAGCATGEEPYSLAMLLAEGGASPAEASVWATDLNPAAVESAARGVFPARRMNGVPEAYVGKYFERSGDHFRVGPVLREYIQFEGQNLAAPVFSKVAPQAFDLILCRNVIIYFDLPTIRGLMDRFLAALRPDAYLLLGYSESLFQVYDKFEMVEVEGAFIYRPGRPKPPPSEAVIAPPKARSAPKPPPRLAPPLQRPPSPVAAPAAPSIRPARRTPWERMSAAAEKMERGDFSEALSDLKTLVKDEPDDIATWLTLGNTFSLLGHADEARSAYDQALAHEPLCVEARLYGGMAAMQSGAFHEARSELSRALFLEPTLALGHYLLAQVEEQLGERESARRSYRNALAQLKEPQRPLAGYYPDMADSLSSISRAARYALAALEEA